MRAWIEPACVAHDGRDPLAYVVSLNLHRRHLNESQRAMVAARIANMRRGDNPPIGGLVSQPDAASMLNVGIKSVERAAKVQRDGVPELAAAVDAGKLAVSAAAFLPTEALALARRLEALERPAAKARQREHGGTAPGKTKNTPGNFPEVISGAGKACDKIASAVGISDRSLRKIEEIVEAAADNPALFGDLPARMDATGKVDTAFRELKKRRTVAEIEAEPALNRPAAKARQIAGKSADGAAGGRGNKKPSANLAEGFAPTGESREKIATAVGLGRSSLRKIEEIVEAAADNPALFGDLPARMDATGKVDTAFRELKKRRTVAEIEAEPALNRPADSAGAC